MSVVPRLLEVLRHYLYVGRETSWHQWLRYGLLLQVIVEHKDLDVHVLPAQSVGVLARHEGGPGRRAGGLDVVLVQQDPLLSQLLQAGAVDVGVVPGDIVPTWRSHLSYQLFFYDLTRSSFSFILTVDVKISDLFW